MSRPLARLFVAFSLFFCVPGLSRADFVVGLDTVLTGDTPTGATPYLSAQFEDVAPNLVRLTMRNLLPLNTTQFVSDWLFNFNPMLNINNLNITYVSGDQASTVNKGNNIAQLTGSSGDFDIEFQFPVSNAMGGALRFNPGDMSVYNFSLTGGMLLSLDFLFGTQNPVSGFVSGAHIQGLPNGGSSKVVNGNPPVIIEEHGQPVPAPASLLLFACGAALLGRRLRTAK